MAPTKGSPDQLLHPLQLRFSKAARRASISWQTKKHIHAPEFPVMGCHPRYPIFVGKLPLPRNESLEWDNRCFEETAGTGWNFIYIYIFLVEVSWDPRDSTRPFFTACLKLLLLGWLGGEPFSMKASKLVLEFC